MRTVLLLNSHVVDLETASRHPRKPRRKPKQPRVSYFFGRLCRLCRSPGTEPALLRPCGRDAPCPGLAVGTRLALFAVPRARSPPCSGLRSGRALPRPCGRDAPCSLCRSPGHGARLPPALRSGRGLLSILRSGRARLTAASVFLFLWLGGCW